MSVGDSIRLLQLTGTAVGRDAMAVGVEYQGGAVEGVGNPMVVSVVWLVSRRACRICTKEYVEIKRVCALVKSILKSLTRGLYTN